MENAGTLDFLYPVTVLNRQCLQKAVEVVECLEKDNTNVLITGKSYTI